MMYGGDMMAYWSFWHWIIFALVAALVLYPVGVILRRIGYSPFWAILVFFPLLNLIGLWLLALSPWPSGSRR